MEVQFLFRPLYGDFGRVARDPVWEDLPAGIDADLRQAAERRLERMRTVWTDLFAVPGDAVRRSADPEDWTENAIQLISAIETGLPVHVVDRNHNASTQLSIARSFASVSSNDRPDAATTFDPARPTILRGTILRQDPLFPGPLLAAGDPPPVNLAWPREGKLHQGEAYWRSDVLREALGRRHVLTSGDQYGANGFQEGCLELARQGCREIMAKIVFQAKYQAPVLVPLDLAALVAHGQASKDQCSEDQRSGDDLDRIVFKAFYEAFDVNLMDCEERPECFLLQERITMESEYRIVVVGGRPVAGAGCVEYLSPPFHEPEHALQGSLLRRPVGSGAFDVKVEGVRNDRQVRRDPELVSLFVEKAAELCDLLAEEESRSGEPNPFFSCVMDFAWDPDRQQVVLVETNPPDNFGLYAMDVAPVTAAIVDLAKGRAPGFDPVADMLEGNQVNTDVPADAPEP